MAPRALPILTCFSDDAANVPLPAKENAHGSEKRQPRRRWTGAIKRKILAATRRPRIWAVREEEEEPCDDVDVEKQRAQAPKLLQATPRREGAPVSQIDRSPSNDAAPDAVAVDGHDLRVRRFDLPPEEKEMSAVAAPEEPRLLPTGVLAAVDGRRKRKGLRVRFDLTPEEISAAPAPPMQPRLPTGVLGEPPESFARSCGADMTAAFLMSVIAEKSRATDSATRQVDGRGLVACWTERKAARSRRLSYLRDYCPFQREEEDAENDEGEESEPETTTTRPEAEPGPVKTGLPFDRPESEASS